MCQRGTSSGTEGAESIWPVDTDSKPRPGPLCATRSPRRTRVGMGVPPGAARHRERPRAQPELPGLEATSPPPPRTRPCRRGHVPPDRLPGTVTYGRYVNVTGKQSGVRGANVRRKEPRMKGSPASASELRDSAGRIRCERRAKGVLRSRYPGGTFCGGSSSPFFLLSPFLPFSVIVLAA